MAKTSPTLQEIFDSNRYDLSEAAKRSRSWYNQQVLLLSKQGITPQKMMKADAGTMSASVMPGRLYMFFYDPKMKKELPYYDRFPLVFPFSKVEGGFLGLNMHYLPYPLRVQLLHRLMVFANNTRMDQTTRLKYSWQMIDGISRYAAAQPCVKHYLMDHVRSPFKQVVSKDWATAMLMPVERFEKSSKEKVWIDTRRKLR
jgi:hypothetical protein